MAKSIFTIKSEFIGQKKSIIEIAKTLIKILKNLAELDKSFLQPIYAREGVEKQLDITESDIEYELADIILSSNRQDILKHEEEENPSVDFFRDFGFNILFLFKEASKKKYSLTSILGSHRYQNVRIEYFNRDFEFSFVWYHSMLNSLVGMTAPYYAGITISLSSFLDLQRPLKVKHPFGWITYFSNDYEIPIPDDLEGVEYEHTDKGKYLILTREDFTTNKETYEAHKQKLLDLMEEIKRRVPEYGK